MPDLSLEESRRLFEGGDREKRRPRTAVEARALLRASISEEEWQNTIIELAQLGRWRFYHALPAQRGVPQRLKERLEEALTELRTRRVLEVARILGGLLKELQQATWRTPVTSKGFPDLVLLRGPELHIWEVKSESGRLKPEQEEWLESWRQVPGVTSVRVVRPRDVEEVRKILA